MNSQSYHDPEKPKSILAIDPGLEGAFVVLDTNDNLLTAYTMPVVGKELDLNEISNIMREAILVYKVRGCVIEKAQVMIKRGAVNRFTGRPTQPPARMFQYGMGFGALRGIAAALGIPTMLIPPHSWTKIMHQGIISTLSPKQKSRIAVSRLFPKIDFRANDNCRVPHEGIVDAVLIAKYAINRF